MVVSRGVIEDCDNFNRAQVMSATPGENGWTLIDTSSAGAPTALCLTEDGGAVKFLIAATDEVEEIGADHNDVLTLDLAKLKHVSFIAKVADVDSLTVVAFGVGNAQNIDEDAITVAALFKMEGATSTTAVVVETDDGTNDNNDVATGKTLAATYKKFTIDFESGLSDVRFFIDGERVAAGTTFDMSDITAGQNVQPIMQVSKPSGTGTPSLTVAQYVAVHSYAYGA